MWQQRLRRLSSSKRLSSKNEFVGLRTFSVERVSELYFWPAKGEVLIFPSMEYMLPGNVNISAVDV